MDGNWPDPEFLYQVRADYYGKVTTINIPDTSWLFINLGLNWEENVLNLSK